MEQHETDIPRGSPPASTTVALAFAMGLASLGTSIANIALPALSRAFEAPFSAAQAVVVAYLAAMTAAAPIAGRLADRHGAGRMLVAGLWMFTGASLACALAPSLAVLVAARAAQGAAAAVLTTLSMALMRQTAGAERVGRAMGLLGTVSALGTALGPSLGGLILPVAGWRGVFWVQVPLGLAAAVAALRALPAEAAVVGRGAVPARAALGSGLLRHYAVNVLVAAVMMATLVVGPFYLGLAAGLDAAAVGLVMAVGPVISILSGVPSGRLVDARGSGAVTRIGLRLLAAGAVLLALLPEWVGLAGYVLAILVLTPGYQLFQAANTTAALDEAPKQARATVSGLLTVSRNLGLVAGATVMGSLFAFAVGSETMAAAAPSAIGAGMRVTFLAAGATMVAALAIATIGRGGVGHPR